MTPSGPACMASVDGPSGPLALETRRFRLLCFNLCLLLLSGALNVACAQEGNPTRPSVVITERAFRLDPLAKRTPDALATPQASFQPLLTESLGYVDGAVWIRVTVRNLRPSAQRVVLSFGNPYIDRISLFDPRAAPPPGSLEPSAKSGLLVPLNERPFGAWRPSFPVSLGANESASVTFRVESQFSVFFDLAVQPQEDFLAWTEARRTAETLYFGTILGILFFNVFFFIYFREIRYLLYILHQILGQLAYFAITTGVAFRWAWPEAVAWNRVAANVVGHLAVASFLLFAMAFMNVQSAPRKTRSFFARTTWALIALLAVSLLLLPLSLRLNNQIFNAAALACVLVVGCASGVSLRHGNRSARFFLVGFAATALLIALMAASAFTLLPVGIDDGLLKIALVVDALLFSWALADRVARERSEALETATEAKRRADESIHARDAFLRNMSHELRTPLTAISGFTDLLLAEPFVESDVRDFHMRIRQNSARLTALVDDLIEVAEANVHALPVRAAEFDLESELRQLIFQFEPLALSKGLALRKVNLGPVPQFLDTDLRRFRHILQNLIGNALKFTESGEVALRVSVSSRGGPEDAAGAPSPARWLVIDVQDTGIGMDVGSREGLFKAFSMGDGSLRRRYGGMGLGLNVSKAHAQACGGDLTLVHSAPGRGSTFRLVLPLHTEAARPRPGDPGDPADGGAQAL